MKTVKVRQAIADYNKLGEVLRVGNIIEDAYIDFHVSEKWPVLGEYIRYSRQKVAEQRPIDLDAIARNPTPARNSVINLWVAFTLYDAELPQKMSAKVKRAITELLGYSVQATQTENAVERVEIACLPSKPLGVSCYFKRSITAFG